MALDVYFREDLANVLAGLLVATIETHAANDRRNPDYLQGAVTMARGLALGFGLRWADVVADVRGELGSGCAGLLDGSH